VGEIGLTTVVDLRSSDELASEGPAPLDGVADVLHFHHPILAEAGSATDAASDVLLIRAGRDRSRYPADPICGHYLGYLEDRPDQVVAALRSVAQSGGAALVHCAAGKDRTGVVVAVALSAVGVRRPAVIADYAATGERIGPVLARLRRSPTYADDISDEPDELQRPRPQTMAAFLEQLDARYGGAARWLAGHGFGPDDLQLLRAKLLRS
jgi:protein tyrosine/serine phosphatase